MEVSFETYLNDLHEFAQKHNASGEFKLFTSGLEDDKYTKAYAWEDGAQFFEVNEKIWEHAEVEIHGLRVPTYIELWRTEYWSTDYGSRYVYQKA